MLLEVIATTAEDAFIAQQAGASRIELVSAISEGGLTPSYGLIEQIVEQVSIPVNVMIRPHSYSFCYSERQLQCMVKDIEVCKKLGVNGVVIGALTNEQVIDEEALTVLVEAAGELDITFHRAFDEVTNQFEALEILSKYPSISRILTSGGEVKVIDAIEQINALIKAVENLNITIMPGSGITLNNIEAFKKEVSFTEVHIGSATHKHSDFRLGMDFNRVQQFRDLVVSNV